MVVNMRPRLDWRLSDVAGSLKSTRIPAAVRNAFAVGSKKDIRETEGQKMFGAFVLVTFVAGIAAACTAPHAPDHVVALERCGGTLMIASLALLGAALPIVH
jgi:hypothetical protein